MLVEEWPGQNITLINLHDDENTCVEAGKQLIARRGGRLVQLRHHNTRLIQFLLQGKMFRFDPNRMFTNRGIRLTLEKEGSISEQAVQEVGEFAAEVLSICRFNDLSAVVTLHNNGEEGYSAESYSEGAVYEEDALKLHLQPSLDPDDFFFVTEPRFFDHFQKSGFNVVLQDNQNVTDDGSLSVLSGRRGIPYINVEAEEGHLTQQIQMLEEVFHCLR